MPNAKEPRGGHGHKDAVPATQFDLSLVPQYANYGIVLDGQYLVVDIDRPDDVTGPYAELGGTWTQTTRRGRHLLYRYGGAGHNKKFPGGDVKVRGYILGPGSVVDGVRYEYRGGTIAPAPRWLIELVESDERTEAVHADVPGVPRGEHDDFLFKLASWLRGRYGLSQGAIEAVLRDGPLAVLEGTDEHDPYTNRDLERLARSAASHEASEALGATTTLRSGSLVAGVPAPQRWVLPGFVPESALTVLYGDGKIGKSSWASWLAARETRKGSKVVFIPSGEESFDLFVMRARLNGCDDSLLYEYADPSFNLGTGVPRLQNAISDLGGVSLVYIDALYSQFGPSSNAENEAVRARRNLMGLALFAEATGTAVLGTIHENAQGNLLGSREVRNVARSLIHAKGGKGKAFTIWSAGANGWSPDYGVAFPGREVPITTPDGEVLSFEDMYGERVPQSIWVLEQGEKVLSTPTEIVVDEIEEPAERVIRDFLVLNPDASNKEIALATGYSPNTIMVKAGPIRRALGIPTRH